MDNIVLELKGVTGKRKGFRFTDINMSLKPGFIYAVTGRNGAGKTTLMNCILSEKSRYSGQICVLGTDVRRNHANVMQVTGFISEDNNFLELRTGEQNASILGLLYEDFDMELFYGSMKKMGVSPGKTYWRMSRGEKMKFQLAFAIAHKSRLYLLDEATAGMDAVFRIELFDMLRELLINEECCVLMTSHNMTEISKQTDYVAVMDNGRLGEFAESIEVMDNGEG